MDVRTIVNTVTINMGTALLILVLSGGSPKLNSYAKLKGIDVNSKEFKTELNHMSGAVTKENGDNSDLIQLLTASVIENRKQSSKWKGSTTEEVVMAKEGKYWQYAKTTRDNFKTVKSSRRTRYLCKFVLIFGPVCPENVVYQGQSKNGSGVYISIPVPGQKDEIFCYE